MSDMEHTKSLLVLGGSSDIGRATALRFAENGWRIFLAGRDLEALRREADDIGARTGATVSIHAIDILDEMSFESFADDLPSLPDAILCVIGLLGTQRLAETDLAHASTVMRSNFEGPALILGLFAERLAARGEGTIIGVSSVAGERGPRLKLRIRRGESRIYGFPLGLAEPLWKNQAARGHGPAGLRAHKDDERYGASGPPYGRSGRGRACHFWCRGEKPREVVYVKPVWLMIMTIIKAIPERVFMKLRI